MSHSISDRVLALSGVFQAGALARQIANTGKADAKALEASVHSLFQIDADDVPSVFGGAQGVAMGLRELVFQLDNPSERDPQTMMMVLGVLRLEQALARSKEAMVRLGAAISDLNVRWQGFELDDSTRFSQMAQLYTDHIRGLASPLMVKGEPLHINNPENAARIRTALLAGVRAARLWRQCGGKRHHWLWQRRKMSSMARELLDQLPE